MNYTKVSEYPRGSSGILMMKVSNYCRIMTKDLLPSLTTFLFTLLLVAFSRSVEPMSFARQDNCPGRAVSLVNCHDALATTSLTGCAAHCIDLLTCVSFLLDSTSGLCHLCDVYTAPDCGNTIVKTGVKIYEFQSTCFNGGQWKNGQCQCTPAYSGVRCEDRMTDCQDWTNAGETGTKAMWVFPEQSPEPFVTMCDTRFNRFLIMKRATTSLDFYRNWSDYANGFGDVSDDHWLGLHKIHQLTHSRCYDLCFQFDMANGSFFQQYYSRFLVSDESAHFTMTFTSSFSMNVNESAGDSLREVKDKPFSTFDADHDDDVNGSCAERHHSGWWFANCTLCNPTGVLKQPPSMHGTGEPTEVFWTRTLGNLSPQKVIIVLYRCSK